MDKLKLRPYYIWVSLSSLFPFVETKMNLDVYKNLKDWFSYSKIINGEQQKV